MAPKPSGTGLRTRLTPEQYRRTQEGGTGRGDRSHGVHRTGVRCVSCGAHPGRVFEDGPQPTGQRFVIDFAAVAIEPEPGR